MYKTLLGATLLFVASNAGAQQGALKECAGIEDSLERLVCYDNLAKIQHGKPQEEAKEKNKSKEMKAKAAQRAEWNDNDNASEQKFGMEHKSGSNTVDRLEVEVASKKQDPYKKWQIELTNGQVWKQTDSRGYFSWEEDDTYYIERGALNSFFFGREGSNRRLRVQRVK
ncbi:MAG: type VI secretion protein [Idiomarina sp.]|nr:type VI secretion protein [Idiomarina sp.]